MRANRRRKFRITLSVCAACLLLLQITAAYTGAYDLGTTVADMTLAASQSGGTSCPQFTRFDVSTPGSINRQWSTSLGASPVTILTANRTPDGQLNEIEAVIQQSLSVWTGVSGTLLAPSTLGTLQRTSTTGACTSADGFNSICFDQNDPGFAFGVLAFTRVVSADSVGERLPSGGAPSKFVGEILDADVLLLPGNPNTTFATPAALPSNPNAYDLESILTHELGHSFGFNHSGVWGAMMFPFAPAPGQFTGTRPTALSPDAPLSDDDRTGLRVLYADPSDSVHIGAISGHVLPANPLALPISPAGVTGVFPAQVVALDNANWNRNRRRDGWLELRRPRPGAIRRHVFLAAIAGRDIAELPDLRGAARRTRGPGKCNLQFDVTVPKRDDRSGLARTVRMHRAGIGSAFFRADTAGTLNFTYAAHRPAI